MNQNHLHKGLILFLKMFDINRHKFFWFRYLKIFTQILNLLITWVLKVVLL